MNHWIRNFILLTLMLAASGMAVALRPTQKIADQGPKINLEKIIPATFGEWQVDNTIIPIQPPPELQEVIDKTYDQTLSKTFFNAAGARIMLSIAYGGNQRREMSTHRPEVCYPGQGFELLSSRPDSLPILGRTLPLTRVIAKQGARNEPITYWVVVGDELTKFGIRHRLTSLKYNLTGSIPDGMLVRVSSIDSDEQHAFKLQNQFINDMLSAMSEKEQIRLLGALPN
jgi:EpsI family protein